MQGKVVAQKMLSEYMDEEFGRSTLTSDAGFVSYKVLGPEFLIGDMFVDKNKRGMGYGQELGLLCEKIAKDRGCEYLSCNVYVDEERPDFVTDKVRKFIKFGFYITRLSHGNITMVKPIKGDK